ncbi:uncharacterized protein [Aegilops tauschii subsp. strangulata]|uniref:uncharacterized protein n=1 Tax=Aegilops tauschii subsp. strangulata TaxID=200361 RepID=UPI00098B16C9|nr:uncharacterized protein LOC109750423 [Aegilops tauschii subsp. strangulata]
MRTKASRRRGAKRRLAALLSRVARSILPCVTVDDDPGAAKASIPQVPPGDYSRQQIVEVEAGQWSDLPGDLLGAVYGRVPTALDRVRLAAVCKSWRAVVTSRRHQAPGALPWLLFPPRDDDMGTERLLRLVGSHDGGWVAAFEEGRRLLAVVSLFSRLELTLSDKQRRLVCTHINRPLRIRKLVFSEAPTSTGCILAAITKRWCVALCRVGCPDGGWAMAPCSHAERVSDVAFCNGELYGLAAYGTEGLIRYEIDVDSDGTPVVTAAHRLAIEKRDGAGFVDDLVAYVSYLFELRGKPAMAVKARWSRNHEPSFGVFELVSTSTDDVYKWAEVTSLGDYALFVGPMTSCKVAHVSVARRGGVQANHIYHLNYRFVFIDDHLGGGATCMDDNGGRALYSGEERQKIVSVGYYVVDPTTAIWLLPPNI